MISETDIGSTLPDPQIYLKLCSKLCRLGRNGKGGDI